MTYLCRLLTIIVLLVLFTAGSKSHVSANLNIVSASKNQNHEGLYSGGSGETIEAAVVINATNSLVGIAAEYQYVSSKCGRRNIDWKLKLQAHLEKNGRHYDVLTVELKKGDRLLFYKGLFYGGIEVKIRRSLLRPGFSQCFLSIWASPTEAYDSIFSMASKRWRR